MECEPWPKPEVAYVALPVLSRVLVPSVVPPSRNVTVPVGVVVPELGDTVAVKVTDCSGRDGFGEEAREVTVAIPAAIADVTPIASIHNTTAALQARSRAH
jgi:hypothetical protein